MHALENAPIHIRYRVLAPAEQDGYVFGIEDARECAAAVAELARACAEETLRAHPLTPVDVVQQQDRGFYTFTARQDGALAGICFARRVREGASDAGMYLSPEHRKGWTAKRFVEFVHRGMQAVGAQWMTWDCDEASGSAALAEYMDLELLSRRYVAKFNQGAKA